MGGYAGPENRTMVPNLAQALNPFLHKGNDLIRNENLCTLNIRILSKH